MARIGIDLDGVVFDFISATKKHFGLDDTVDRSTYDCIHSWGLDDKEWNKWLHSPSTYLGLGLIEGVREGLIQIARQHYIDYVTARPPHWEIYESSKLSISKMDLPAGSFFNPQDKEQFYHCAHFLAIVDDKPNTVNHAPKQTTAFHFWEGECKDRIYDRVVQVHSWEETIKEMKLRRILR